MARPTDARNNRATLGALKPLAGFALNYRGRIAAAMLALIAASAATLVVPIAVRRVVDHGFSEPDGSVISAYFGMLIVVVAVLALASSLRYYFVITLGERVVADVRAAVFRRLTALDPAFFDATQTGEIVSRLTADTTQVKSAFGASISVALRNIVLFVGAIGLMIWTSPKLSALVLLAIPLIVVPLVLSGRKVRARSRAAQDRLAEASAYASEAIGAVRTMQAFGMERVTAARFQGAAEDAYEAARISVTARAALTGVTIFMVSASVVGVLWYGAQDVLTGTMTAGRLSQFVLYAVFAASSLGQLSEVYGELAQAAGSAERLGEILAAQPAVEVPAQPRALPQPSPGTVAFEGGMVKLVPAWHTSSYFDGTTFVAPGIPAGLAWYGNALDQLPALLTMEKILFRMIAIGFGLLTLTVLSGVVFSEQVFGKAVNWDHKSVFAVLSWVLFGILLTGRTWWGWRGKTALRFTLSGFATLVLAYVGSRFVIEVILHRALG